MRIELPDPKPAPPPPPADRVPAAQPPRAERSAGTAIAYDAIAISDPVQDETVRDNGGNLIVSVMLEPPLQVDFGHRLQLLLDGAVYATEAAPNFSLVELDRGTHTLQALVLDADGQALATSSPVTFHLHRTTVRQIERIRAIERQLESQRAE